MKISFILLSLLISSSLQIDHCFIEKKRCKTCIPGYTLSDDTINNNKYCIKFDTCKTLSVDGKTYTECQEGYILSTDGTSCKRDTCLSYNSETNLCESCTSYYKLDADNNCVPQIEHCIGYIDETHCYDCDKGYAANNANGKCVEFPNCSEVNDDGTKCIGCKYDYYQPDESGQCVINYCEELDEDTGKCEECEKYFDLQGDICEYINIDFCRKIENGQCKKWAGFLKYGEDINEAKEKYELRCESFDANGKCTYCQYGFIYNEEEKTCSQNCEQYDEPVCEYCDPGYILLETDNGGTICHPVSSENKGEEGEGEGTTNSNKENASNFIFRNNLILKFLLFFIGF